MALFTDLFVEKAANCRFGLIDKVLRSQFQLQSSHSGTDENVWKIHAGFVDIGGKWLLHADGRTTSADVSRQWKELFHRNQVAFLVARNFSSQLQVHLMFSRDDTNKIARLVSMKHKCLEHLVDVLSQAFRYMRGALIVFIDFIRDEFVFHLGLVQQACCIGLVYLFFLCVFFLFTTE